MNTTSIQFVKWMWYLNWRDIKEFRREDFYLAQISSSVERGNVKNPSKVTIKSHMLKFGSEGGLKKQGTDIQTSKNFWRGLLNIYKKIKPK